MTLKQRTPERYQNIANRVWRGVNRQIEGLETDSGIEGRMAVMNFSFKWLDICTKLARSERVEDRIFAAEQVAKLYEATAGIMTNGIIFDRVAGVLVKDPDVRVKAAFLKGMCTPRNILKIGKGLVDLVKSGGSVKVLTAIYEGAMETAKNDKASEKTREMAGRVLVNIIPNISIRGELALRLRMMEEFNALDPICQKKPVIEMLEQLSKGLQETQETKKQWPDRKLNASVIVITIFLIETVRQLRITEIIGTLQELLICPLITPEIKERINLALLDFGIGVSFGKLEQSYGLE
ncbi:MAG: hypothetical protein Q7S22_06765 [Candidatus Micrarchaeota archaeon]|nr:hypothetical protein [Candidatus Micrarchaeota archaeon]